MATPKRNGKGWRVQLEICGVRASKTLPTKAEILAWAAEKETEIRQQAASSGSGFPAKTVADALTRYELEVSSQKRGGPTEAKRLAAIARDFPALAAKVMHEVTTTDLAEWRDARLAVVTKGSVQRDVNLLRNVWTIAGNEWRWCENPGPWRGFRAPGENQARDRLPTASEVRRLLRWAGYKTGKPPTSKSEFVAWLFLAALHTAMRVSELLAVTPADMRGRVATLTKHKTVELVGPRDVPMSRRGVQVMTVVAEAQERLQMTPARVDALFRKLRDQCLIDGLHFHDSRASALTRMSRKVDVMTLARVSGHRDLRVLMNTYYRESADSIAERL